MKTITIITSSLASLSLGAILIYVSIIYSPDVTAQRISFEGASTPVTLTGGP